MPSSYIITSHLTTRLNTTNVEYHFECPLGECISNKVSTYLGLVTQTVETFNTSSIRHYFHLSTLQNTFVIFRQIQKSSYRKHLHGIQTHIKTYKNSKFMDLYGKRLTKLSLTRSISNIAVILEMPIALSQLVLLLAFNRIIYFCKSFCLFFPSTLYMNVYDS